MYQIKIEKRAAKFIAKLPPKDQDIIFRKLDILKVDPYNKRRNITQLKGRKGNEFRIRVKEYRIIYSVYQNELLILVLEAGYRKDIYR